MGKYGEDWAYEALKNLQNLPENELKSKIDELLGDTYEHRMEGTITNSPIGSAHWYNTILSYSVHCAEFFATMTENDVERANVYGKELEIKIRHLLDNYDKIPFNNY
jgi:hypothetical protein